MKEFVEENKNLVIVVSIALILGSLFVSVRKVLFYSPPGEDEKPVFLDVYGEEITVPEGETAVPQFFDLNILFLMVITSLFLVGGWLLIRKLKGKRPPVENKKDRIKKDDLKRIQEALELYYRLRQRYPEAGDDFREIIKNLKPPLEDSPTLYRYENQESDTQRYRLWCLLEDKDCLEAREGLYELSSDKTAA